MMTRISINPSHLEEVHRLLADRKKIQAIKVVRHNGRYVSSEKSGSPGLKDAKLAIDALCSGKASSHELVSDWRVHSVTVSGPAGEQIRLDLETLQMHFLTTLSSVGIEEVNRLLDLVDFVKQWQGEIPAAEKNRADVGEEDESR